MTRILIIEDHDTLRNQLMQVLQLTQYDVVGASNGSMGTQLASDLRPDLILCDIMMGKMDGYEVLRHVRQNPATAATPFIFMTAKDDRASLRQGMALGADDYLTKPFTTDELLSAIQTRLDRRDIYARDIERGLEMARQQLMHLVTHELRTPVSSINMVVDIISRQMELMTPDQLHELLDTLGSGSKRLSRLVDQIVFVTQLRIGALAPDAIAQRGVNLPVWDMMVAAIGLARKFAYRNASLNIDLDDRDNQALVTSNPLALKHALAELISNALNFSPEDGTVTIAQWVADQTVWLSITDSGPGIQPNQIDRALEMFQQIDRSTQEQQGMGLGLGLAHHLIQAHGGTLQLASVPGKGTQATIALPMTA